MIQIKHRITGRVIIEADNVRDGIVLALNRGLDLRCADLRGADLHDLDLTGADLGGVDITGANLTGAILTDAYLGGSITDGTSIAHVPGGVALA